jgi:hypothetical protein
MTRHKTTTAFALAPTRRGGVLKKLLVTLAILIGVVVLLVGYEAVLAVTSKPAITHNYSQEIHDRGLERQRAHFGDGLNQYPRFEEHMGEVYAANDWLKAQSDALPRDHDNPWPLIDFGIIRGTSEDPYREEGDNIPAYYAQAKQRAIDALDHWRDIGIFDRAADIATIERIAIPPVDGWIIEMLLPHLGASRQLARAQAARMRLAAQAGDHEQVQTAFEENLALARLTADQGFLICWLVGVAISDLSLSELADGLVLHPPTDERWLLDADAAIEREQMGLFPSLQLALENERLAVADIVQRVYTDSGRLMPQKIAGHAIFGDSPLSNITARAYYDRQETDAWLDRAYELSIAAANAKGPDAAAADERAERFLDDIAWNNVVGDNFMIATHRSARTGRARQIRAAGTRVLLAIERHRLRHGAIPQTLEALGDLLPESLRTDPFTGQPWDYQPTPMTTRANGEPLEPNDTVWPYTLASRPLPGTTPQRPSEHDPYEGILITTPVEGNSLDEPYTEADDEN